MMVGPKKNGSNGVQIAYRWGAASNEEIHK